MHRLVPISASCQAIWRDDEPFSSLPAGSFLEGAKHFCFLHFRIVPQGFLCSILRRLCRATWMSIVCSRKLPRLVDSQQVESSLVTMRR